jgi:hypothetical protein
LRWYVNSDCHTPFGGSPRTARATNDAILEAGGEPDYLGDLACNAGEHSTRHHAANRAWRSALAAVAIGEVILGDKAESR